MRDPAICSRDLAFYDIILNKQKKTRIEG